ncbi:dUTPase-like protein [Wolfiporia cocos MD-104 SS10]|uniref:Deoxyuridine 5'-triphosphate nucleotidohydrolase n=1 Tax=Wolfiporia cocos (strain MD-104) TaxID=742152 RepID=A0A2H3JLH4_WOLCO|nr:dUTPase-like protein [Wolfiporia cocos MD-104 SS10]
MIDTGLKILFPYGMYSQLISQSSMAKKSLMVAGGIINWDYRGEVKVMIHNLSQEPYEVKAKDKIAQLLVHQQPHPEV